MAGGQYQFGQSCTTEVCRDSVGRHDLPINARSAPTDNPLFASRSGRTCLTSKG